MRWWTRLNFRRDAQFKVLSVGWFFCLYGLLVVFYGNFVNLGLQFYVVLQYTYICVIHIWLLTACCFSGFKVCTLSLPFAKHFQPSCFAREKCLKANNVGELQSALSSLIPHYIYHLDREKSCISVLDKINLRTNWSRRKFTDFLLFD